MMAVLLLAPTAAAEDEVDMAKVQFEQGVALYQDEDFEGALVMFKASAELNPNYKVLYNIGLCYQALHQYVEAEKELKAYLFEGAGKISTKRIAEVNDILLELDTVIGEIQITSNMDGAKVFLDGEELGETPIIVPVRVDVGKHEIRVVKEGFLDFETTVSTPGKVTVKVEVELQKEEPDLPIKPAKAVKKPKKKEKPAKKKKLPRGVFLAGVGLTAAVAVAAAVTGGLALGKNKEFKDTYYEDTDEWRALRDDGRKLALTSDVLWGVAGGVAAATIVTAIFTDFSGGEKVSLSPFVDPTLVGLDLTLRFRGM
jgi:hypothetical protein